MCEYFCIELIDFMLEGKSLTDFTFLFLPNFKKNDNINFTSLEIGIDDISNIRLKFQV